MLKQRILVALIFLPLFVWLIIWPDPTPLFVFALLGLSVALTELAHLIRSHGTPVRRGLAYPAVILMGLAAGFPEPMLGWGPLTVPMALGAIVLGTCLLLCFRELFATDHAHSLETVSLTLFSVVLLGGVGSFVFLLRRLPGGYWWLILLFGFNWLYDAGALFSGMLFGKHKLAPHISPGKTVEGLIGGLLINLAAAPLVYALLLPPGHLGFTLPGFMALAVLLGVLAQAGDLAESMIKRWSGVKDSAGFIPGHGGVLDKIDNLIFTAPVLYVLVRWLLHP